MVDEESGIGYPVGSGKDTGQTGYPAATKSRGGESVKTPMNMEDKPESPAIRSQSVTRRTKESRRPMSDDTAKRIGFGLVIAFLIVLVAASVTIPIGVSLDWFQWFVLAILSALPALFVILFGADNTILGFLFGLAGFAVHLCIFFSDLNYSGVSSILFMVSALMLIPITYLQERYDFMWFVPI